MVAIRGNRVLVLVSQDVSVIYDLLHYQIFAWGKTFLVTVSRFFGI